MATNAEQSQAHSWFTLNRVGSKGSPVLFVSGPPTSGAVFARVQERLSPRRSLAVECVAFPEEFSAERFQEELGRLCEQEGVRVLVVHGLALPLVLGASLPMIDLLVLSNGPLSRLDVFSKTLSKLPQVAMEKALLRPGLFTKWLASSVGLRRAVVNPYVMDPETVQELSQPFLATPAARKMTALWLKSAARCLPVEIPSDTKVVAIWGDLDFLYKAEEIEQFQDVDLILVPGGRFLHPQERPWELADACLELCANSGV